MTGDLMLSEDSAEFHLLIDVASHSLCKNADEIWDRLLPFTFMRESTVVLNFGPPLQTLADLESREAVCRLVAAQQFPV